MKLQNPVRLAIAVAALSRTTPTPVLAFFVGQGKTSPLRPHPTAGGATLSPSSKSLPTKQQRQMHQQQQPGRPIVTCLFAEEEDDNNNKKETTEEQQQQATETTAAGDDTGAGDATDILNSPAFLSRKLDVLKSDVERMEEELAAANERVEVAKEEWGPQLDQLQNEYSNIRDRMSSQNEQGDAIAIVTVVKEVLDLLDNFDRAYGVIKPETDEEVAVQAEFKAAYQGILSTFEELGVMEVKTVGTEFDYELHQAIMQMPGTEYEEGVVCQEFQKGFIMGEDTLIRPAMVAVAA